MNRTLPPPPTADVAVLDAEIEALRREHRARARAVCERARAQFVIPFCERTGLRLYVNGIDWGFVICGTSVLISPDRGQAVPELEEIFAVLSRELTEGERGDTVATYQAEYVPASYGRGELPASLARIIQVSARDAADAPAIACDRRLPAETLRLHFENDFREAAQTDEGPLAFDPLERDVRGEYAFDIARLAWAEYQAGYLAACQRYEADPAWRQEERDWRAQRQARRAETDEDIAS